MSSADIHLLLSHCPNLERLCVWYSHTAYKDDGVLVSEELVKLKVLEFVTCYGAAIKVYSPNIVSLRFSGLVNKLRVVKRLPLLSELSLGEGFCTAEVKTGFQNFGNFSQLKSLSLQLPDQAVRESGSFPLEFPKLKLERLEVAMSSFDSYCLLWPIVLIKAAPLLRSFSVKTRALSSKHAKEQDDVSNLRNVSTKQGRHQCLKLIEMRSFSGRSPEMELAQELLGISEALEHFVVVPACPRGRETPSENDPCWPYKIFRGKARELSVRVPSGVKFEVL